MPVELTVLSVPPAVGRTQLVWQLAAVELQPIMHVVTADVTEEVSGVIGVNACCAEAAVTKAESAAANPNTIAARRMPASAVSRFAPAQRTGRRHDSAVKMTPER